MYNLLIVEDESFARDGLLRHINWKSMNIAHIRAAANGVSALEIVQNFEPHIMLSDIKMPHMNGIELATIIREKFPNCKILFLSGYADKKYLLSAIALKVECFLEKPINLDEVQSAVASTIAQLDREQSIKTSSAHTALDILPLLQKQLISDLLKENFDWDTFAAKYVPNYFLWKCDDICHVVCIRFYCSTNNFHPDEIINFITVFIEKNSSLQKQDYYMNITEHNEISLLIRSDYTKTFYDTMLSLQRNFQENLGIKTTIGISRKCTNLSQLHLLYHNTSRAADYQYFYNDQPCIFEAGSTLPDKIAPSEIFHKKNFVLSGVEQLFDTIKKEKYTNIRDIRLQLYEYYTLMMERTMNDHTMSWEQFQNYTLQEYIELIGYGMKAYQILGNNLYDIKIKNAVHFILWNYQKPELSIQLIAQHVDLSPNYLCSLFKKQTGSTVNDFIIKIRMDKAKILLEKSDLRLYEIAERVGLSDANYFSTLFKNEYGCSPSNYRQNYMLRKDGKK